MGGRGSTSSRMEKIGKHMSTGGLDSGSEAGTDGRTSQKIGHFEASIKAKNVENAGLYNNGVNVFTRTVGAKDHVGFEQSHINAIKKTNGRGVLTHNHPNSTGLSHADYDFAVKTNLKSIRAVGRKATYEITRKGTKWNNVSSDKIKSTFEKSLEKHFVKNKRNWDDSVRLANHDVAKLVGGNLKIKLK